MSEQAITLYAPVVFEQGDQIYTNSLSVATCFKKAHAHVLRDIQRLIADSPKEFGESNFGLSSYTNSQGKEQPLYNLTFDGFILLAMGYTGPKALQVKLLYIAEFNRMRALLEQRKLQAADKPLLSPAERSKLKTIVDAKMSVYPKEAQKAARSELWSRFNRHFELASYSQLPPQKLDEAVNYIIDMNLKATEKYDAEPFSLAAASTDDIHQLRLLACSLLGRCKGYHDALEMVMAKF